MKQIKKNEVTRKTVCLYDEQWQRVAAEAQRVGMTQNGVIRSIITMYFADMDRKERMTDGAVEE